MPGFPVQLIASDRVGGVVQSILFGILMKFLRVGVQVIKIPGIWRARAEGESRNTFARDFDYFRIGLRMEFVTGREILRQQSRQT
jgi:hypothetical protein